MTRNYFLNICLLLACTLGFSQTKSPSQFLGYELGSRFTQHFQVVDYFQYIAGEHKNVKLLSYGETYENRPLYLAFVSSQENMSNLEEIRKNHLNNLEDPGNGKKESEIAIVWLSYNVHGNESVSSEVALQALYELVNPDHEESKEWLKNTLVIIDPCLNPDGRERYVNWYKQNKGVRFNSNSYVAEHKEAWPGGRGNHYLFDLNRDWAWVSQTESRSRLKVFNQWMPHVHVDFHEQGIESPYYFAPASKPFHEIVTPFQNEFQTLVGKNHAKYFDAKGWLYFTRETFDLLYPSYGDTYPLFNGAIGMTYEQGGSGAAGLSVKTKDGNLLTLKDRIEHHLTTSMSTVEVSSQNSDLLISEFKKYFENARERPFGKYKAYVVKGKERDKIKALTEFLDIHKISYGSPTKRASASGYSYLSNEMSKFQIEEEDLVISMYQAKSNLVKTLFEPRTKLMDSLTYDITAWSVPFAHGLDAYALESNIQTKSFHNENKEKDSVSNENPYAFIVKWKSKTDAAFLGYLLQNKVKVSFATRNFSISNTMHAAGSLIITKAANRDLMDFNKVISEGATKYNREIYSTSSGWSANGPDLGSNKMKYLKAPKVAVLKGKEVYSSSFGFVWHFLDQELGYELNIVNTSDFSMSDLNKFNVLILPEGSYNKVFDKEKMKKLSTWIQNGGKIIAIGAANSIFAKSKDFELSDFESEAMKKKEELRKDSIQKTKRLQPYYMKERSHLSHAVNGGVYKVFLDGTNPLGYGYENNYFSLKKSGRSYSYLKSGQNVGVIREGSNPVSGFVGENSLKKLNRSLVFGVEKKGKGSLVYLVDDPLYRSFWENGKLLFSNAIFMVGNE
ncbi:M14 metallopeptidase family protein [Lutimonas zeaxanthinifaciens]|uniref:M14 metallopeptidase family protein n=1 Tax=Lutimonas zeaxanthinifaciens TaxID=3060215 RepID=UPI00265CD591|nr:M14 metallopeptidase family protein [Lutimonas sp. YSD2104]WKK66957.1 M14 family metallopeptidase [Lutimonas sp. YSD2104]